VTERRKSSLRKHGPSPNDAICTFPVEPSRYVRLRGRTVECYGLRSRNGKSVHFKLTPFGVPFYIFLNSSVSDFPDLILRPSPAFLA